MSAPFYSPIDMQQVTGQNINGFNTEPVPISTYQDTEPLHVKDGFWEQDFNRQGEPIAEPEPSFQANETDLNHLPAIPPVSTGQGLPYAPVDWPSPGDVWTWRVGKRVNAVGYHQDRFLILPQRIQYKGIPKSFASKTLLLRYIQSFFPDMDADAFFKSFSWKIPALFQPSNQVEETPKQVQRKRKPYEPVEEKAKATPRGSYKKKKEAATGQQSSTRPKSSRQAVKRSTSHHNEEEVEPAYAQNASGRRNKRRVSFEEEISIPHIYVSPMNGVLAVSHSPIDVNPEEFDTYLNSLDNLLHEGQQDISQNQNPSVFVSVSSPMREYEWAEARMKVSSLLEKDFPALFFSKEASEIASLATKLRKDPSLSAEEIVRLKLIEEIPTFSQVFIENKGVIEEADKFFSSLELNKAKVASLKYEYSDLKHKLGGIEMDIEANTEAIRQIDEEISQLQARRSELKRYIGSKEKEKVDFSYGQKMVANSIPKVVEEVQSGNSKKLEWECKKENAIKREVEIISKFNPLKGFFL